MTNTTKHCAEAWTEVEFSAACYSPYITSPVYLPKETNYYLCRKDGSREQERLTFVVFKAANATDDEWEDDPMLGDIYLTILGDGDEEVEPVKVLNLGVAPEDFISVAAEDDKSITFKIKWRYGKVEIDKATQTDEGFTISKEAFGDEGINCRLTPRRDGEPFSIRLQIPYVGFALMDAAGKRVTDEVAINYDEVDNYTFSFVGDDTTDRFSITLDDGKLNYLCILREDGEIAVRNLRERLSMVKEIHNNTKLSELLMGAHTALIKHKSNRWRITLKGADFEEAEALQCDPVALARFAFEQFTAEENIDEAQLANRLIHLEQKLAFQWFWMKEEDWSHENMEGLMDMEGLDENPEKMMQQALLFNKYETFMKQLCAFSYVSQKPIQGDQLQARNNKRKIARCAKHILAHRAGEENIWQLEEEERKEILDLFGTFHREFEAALQEEVKQ